MTKKKNLVLIALLLMVGFAGFFNWTYNNSDNGVVSDDDYALGEVRLGFPHQSGLAS